jgi:hypothetical protein
MNKEREQEEILDVMRRSREAHERLLHHVENWRTGKYKPFDAKSVAPDIGERRRKICEDRPMD